MTHSKTRILVEGALMVALAFVLSLIKIPLVMGGSITLFCMVPLIVFSYRHGAKWGVLAALAFSMIKLLLGLENLMYCATLASQIGCILLDYVLAYTVLGCAVLIAKRFTNQTLGYAFGAASVCFGRFVCSFLSGVLIWQSYAPEDMPVWLYSLVYNGGYMLPEIVLTTVAIIVLYRTMPKLFAAV